MNECPDIRILYIENDPRISQNFKAALERTGERTGERTEKKNRDDTDSQQSEQQFLIDIAKTGEMGLTQWVQSTYDLVAIGCNLPDLSAASIAHKLLSVNINLPLLVVTTRGHEHLAFEAMSHGAVDYVIRDDEEAYLNYVHLIITKLLDRGRRRVEHVETEQALKQSEYRLRSVITASPVCIHEIDLNGKFISMNPAGLEMMGAAEESSVCGLKYIDVPIIEDRTRISELLEHAKKGLSSRFEFQAPGDKGPLHFSSSFDPIKDDQGNVVRLMGITEDITLRKQAEAALRDTRDELELRVKERTAKLNDPRQSRGLKRVSPLKGQIGNR
ncbi:PAS domain S-box protein [Kiloniella sp.]|uniref:PAS domain S-box protein n=1 Tax=Kiloniella sp. TaxID=1938587 RepID=UPI003B02A329